MTPLCRAVLFFPFSSSFHAQHRLIRGVQDGNSNLPPSRCPICIDHGVFCANLAVHNNTSLIPVTRGKPNVELSFKNYRDVLISMNGWCKSCDRVDKSHHGSWFSRRELLKRKCSLFKFPSNRRNRPQSNFSRLVIYTMAQGGKKQPALQTAVLAAAGLKMRLRGEPSPKN